MVASRKKDMKLLILTSSIFYLLGLKLTHEVDLPKPLKVDSISITTSAEKIKMPEVKQEKIQSTDSKTDKPDSVKQSGSSENTAPCYQFLEGIK